MKNPFSIVILSIFVAACAPAVHRGLVAMKIDEEIAHVCVDKNEVKPGDRIVLYRNICDQFAPKDPRRINCTKHKIGDGLIIELLNEHYAIAKFPNETGFREGDMVERDN